MRGDRLRRATVHRRVAEDRWTDDEEEATTRQSPSGGPPRLRRFFNYCCLPFSLGTSSAATPGSGRIGVPPSSLGSKRNLVPSPSVGVIDLF